MKAGWVRQSLGECCDLIGRGIAPKYVEEGGVRVINQKCIRDHRIDFTLARRHDVAVKRVPPERIVCIGDVLVNSTGTGTLGRVAQIRITPDEPTTVDTHVTIVRPRAGLFHPEFFGHALISIEGALLAGGVGASGQTELPRTDLETKYSVCYPTSHDEQKRIVAVLDEAFEGLSRARTNAEANAADADHLFFAALDRIFRIEGAIWPTATLPSVCIEFGRGKSRHRPRNDPRLYDGPHPFIQTGDISRAGHLLTDFEQTYSDFGLQQSKLWKAGTVCVAIVGATIGESAVTSFDCCFPDSIIGMTPDPQKADAEFLEYALCCFKAELKEAGKGSARDNINLATFEGRQFPMPDIQTQRAVVERLKETSRLKEEVKSECQLRLASLEDLRQSLLQKAFAGELTAAKPVASTGNADLDAVLDELFADDASDVAPSHDPDAARRVKRIREILSDEWNGE